MSGPCCGDGSASGPAPVFAAGRSLSAAGWVVPGVALLLMPKCPLCVAAYVAAGTGIGISLASAAALRTGAIILCMAWLIGLTARQVRRWL